MKIFSSLLIIAIVFMGCCDNKDVKSVEDLPMYETIQTVRMTVAEGKRLIAKGVSNNKDVKERLENGVVIITRGTTNTYIAEELMGLDRPRGSFVTGKIVPSSGDRFEEPERILEIVLVNGERVDMSYADALAMMTEKDIVFKGANLLNYEKRQVAVNVGSKDGGTVARLRKYTDQGKGRWIVPIGLEKDCSADLKFQSDMLEKNSDSRQGSVLLNVGNGGVYTEIEAIKEFADVDVYQVARGGIYGAEGGISLMICGSDVEVTKIVDVVKNIHGEAPFIP